MIRDLDTVGSRTGDSVRCTRHDMPGRDRAGIYGLHLPGADFEGA